MFIRKSRRCKNICPAAATVDVSVLHQEKEELFNRYSCSTVDHISHMYKLSLYKIKPNYIPTAIAQV